MKFNIITTTHTRQPHEGYVAFLERMLNMLIAIQKETVEALVQASAIASNKIVNLNAQIAELTQAKASVDAEVATLQAQLANVPVEDGTFSQSVVDAASALSASASA